MGKNIGFVSTRFAGVDGVSLEARKWAEVLTENDYKCFWFAGELDMDPKRSMLVKEAHFQHATNIKINDRIFGKQARTLTVTNDIQDLKVYLKKQLRIFIERFSIDMLIVQNALAIPMQVPLGMALTETIAELQIPCIAHHHDFYWERTRFLLNAIGDYIGMAFPPSLPNIEHVVINSVAHEELAHRQGISSTIIPNVLNFEKPPHIERERSVKLRETIGLSPEDKMILQPTRIVQRKGIEHAIELVSELDNPHCKLFISHEAGDEGFEYVEWLKNYAEDVDVDMRLIDTCIKDPWNFRARDKDRHSLWDIYPHADFITFPSMYEGFGNAFLEAVYFKKPLLINRYAIFARDIEPHGFDVVVMDGFITPKTVEKALDILTNPELAKKIVEHNYRIALRHYSYATLRRSLNFLISKFFGVDN
ncbi:MAG: glycosyltransferase family 4 protein [Desulfobacterales bacterium]|nr:glycosyltransferase family 4 protein [Desulfobacterales bacterium]